MEPINTNPVTYRDALGVANDTAVVSRVATLGFAPTLISQGALAVPSAVAGGTRLIKCVYLPLHINDLADQTSKAFEERKAHKRDIHVANALNSTACLIEDVGLIGLGLSAVKIVGSTAFQVVAGAVAGAGVILQVVSVYSDFKKIKNGEKHLKALDEKNVNYLKDKTQFSSFSDAVGFKRKTVNGIMERIQTKAKEENDPTLEGRYFANLKSRVELGIFARELNIFLSIMCAVAVIFQFIPPLALVGWGIIGAVALVTIALAIYRLVQTHKLNKELAALAA